MKKSQTLCCALLMILVCHSGYATDLAVSYQNKGGVIHVTHPLFSLRINPDKGGVIEQLTIGKDLPTIPASGGKIRFTGLLLDHLCPQTWPGELLDRKYSIKKIECDGKTFDLILSVELKGMTDGDSVRGLVFKKRFFLKADSYSVQVTYGIGNPTNEARPCELWVQNVVSVGGEEARNLFMRPVSSGIDLAEAEGSFSDIKYKGNEWVNKPYAGWSAAVNPRLEAGLLVLADYNYLNKLYNCLSSKSFEFFFDKINLPPGKTWETNLQIRPFTGLPGISHADSSVICNFEESRDQTGVVMTSAVAGMNRKLTDCQVKLYLQRFSNQTRLIEKTFDFPKLEFAPVKCSVDYPVGLEAESLLLKCFLTSEKNSKHYAEKFFPPVQAEAMQAFVSGYSPDRPRKIQKLFKPQVIERQPNGKLDALLMQGLFYEEWKIAEALKEIPDCEVTTSWHSVHNNDSSYVGKVDFFPDNYQDLMKYDLIVLANVPWAALDNSAETYLADFVKYGGSLVILGGRYTFKKSDCSSELLRDFFAGQAISDFNIKATEFLPVSVDQQFSSAVFSGGVKYLHVLPLSKRLNKVAMAGTYPFWVRHGFGRGEVALCMATVEGKAPEGKQLFWQTTGWQEFLADQINRMVKEK